MPVYNVGEIIEVQIIGNAYGEKSMNVVHFKMKAQALTGFVIGDELNNGWCTLLRQMISVSFKWTGYNIRKVEPHPVTEYEQILSNQLLGLGSGGTLPKQCAALWALKTLLNAPAGRGRIYHAGIPGTAWVEGNWTGTYINTVNQRITAILQRYGPGGTSPYLQLGVASRQVDPVAWNPVHNIIFRSQPATIRTRRGT